MTQEQFNSLSSGDIVRGEMSNDVYVVLGNYGNRVTAVRTADLTNPIEWKLVFKAKLKRVED